MATDHRENNLRRRMASCRHFTGLQNETCEAGIPYESIKDKSVRPFKLPCLDPDSAVHCDSASYYSREEAEAREVEIGESLRKIMKARVAIVEETGGKRGVAGKIPCPVCETGSLHYSVARINGHIHAGCTTKGCVSWME